MRKPNNIIIICGLQYIKIINELGIQKTKLDYKIH